MAVRRRVGGVAREETMVFNGVSKVRALCQNRTVACVVVNQRGVERIGARVVLARGVFG